MKFHTGFTSFQLIYTHAVRCMVVYMQGVHSDSSLHAVVGRGIQAMLEKQIPLQPPWNYIILTWINR